VDSVDSVDTDTDRAAHSQVTADAKAGVTALYEAHAFGLIRLAIIMLGDRGAAEDVVQDAFFGLYRNWGRLSDPANALAYARSSVLNGCRAVLRQQTRRDRRDRAAASGTRPVFESAESLVLLSEEHREVLLAVRRLPDRQREALVLRFYADMSEAQIADAMCISRGAVKSHTARAMQALRVVLERDA
jgi:RNA polymerase sigma-70 factor (sigma-E family)